MPARYLTSEPRDYLYFFTGKKKKNIHLISRINLRSTRPTCSSRVVTFGRKQTCCRNLSIYGHRERSSQDLPREETKINGFVIASKQVKPTDLYLHFNFPPVPTKYDIFDERTCEDYLYLGTRRYSTNRQLQFSG